MESVLRVRIGNKDFYPSDFSGDLTQNEVGSFKFSVPRRQIIELGDLYRRDVKVYLNGDQYITGLVIGRTEYQLGEDNVVIAQVPFLDELGRLTCIRSKQYGGHFQNQPVVTILRDLLDLSTQNWELGSTSTMTDPTVLTTIDLRNKQSRFAQVVEVVKSVPGLFLKYGGYNQTTGRHRIDIGFFGRNMGYRLIQGSNVMSIGYRENDTQRVSVMAAFGGKAGTTLVTLEHAYNHNPALAFHPQFPIQFDGEDWVVLNLTDPQGCETTKDFQVFKTSNQDGNEPTPPQIFEAGFGLWQKCVRFFQENTPSQHYTTRIISNEIPPVNENGFLSGRVTENLYNRITHQEESINTFEVHQWVRIVKASVTLKDNLLEWNIEQDTNEFWKTDDSDLELYDMLEQTDQYDRPVDPVLGQPVTLVQKVDKNHVGVASDCTAGGINGKIFTVPTPVPPSLQVTGVFPVIVANPVNAVVTITQYPSIVPSLPLIACVTLGAGWTALSNVTLSVYFMFTT